MLHTSHGPWRGESRDASAEGSLASASRHDTLNHCPCSLTHTLAKSYLLSEPVRRGRPSRHDALLVYSTGVESYA
eukprot:2421765-Prymnesium_polylepis.2